ncbi:YccF domain-containing protein [Bisgaard Taxon 10/6]|uniref:YccF domain-containing protein n=1 Tax=Exercitatus varius TaxID=67857 RepID=UPI00294B0DE1|nr:YccF domain-containing protein [Exercitatus varius]MDG2915161.1 YccF domain-containing protein [Exercitatus varius]MDG2947635.1 YccF domain-containing protein [Exercitatus varius]MDG2962249.1 YccF domain-containing protein [Exercitatus varius]
MALILNILNFVLGGFAVTLGWLIATIFSAVLIITLPYTRSCWEITKMSLIPFGNDIIHVKYLEPKSAAQNTLGSVLNLVWFILFGWWLCLAHIFVGIAQCLSVIGIPTGLAHFKLAPISLFPVGQRVVSKETAQLARQYAAEKEFESKRNA